MGWTSALAAAVALSGWLPAWAPATRPPPPPAWSSSLSQPVLRPGKLVGYRYTVTSSDRLELLVSVQSLSRLSG